MKKTVLILAAIVSLNFLQAQETEHGLNKWSVELNAGVNKPMNPFSLGYHSDNSEHSINIGNSINTYELGLRYMLSSNFGLKAKFGYDSFENAKNSSSLPFQSEQLRFDLQGVVNMGSILKFNEFTSRLGLLAHAGGFVSQFSPEKKTEEYNGGIVAGITPQVRLSNRFALNLDLSGYYGLRQDYSFDGMNRNTNKNLTSLMFATTAGLTYYLGKNTKHVDWASLTKEKEVSELDAARKRIAELESKLVDSDNDGVLDFLDLEKNTASNAMVDSRGRVMAQKVKESKQIEAPVKLSPADQAFSGLVEGGFVNVFYNVNKDQPMNSSLESVYSIYHYMKTYPSSKVLIKGFADVTGAERYNKELSELRANNIYKFLVKSGISSDRLEIASFGEEDTSNNSSLGLQMARRVTFSLK